MKKGFTLIEMLVTTIIFGLFIIICYPLLNNLTKNLNLINELQINNLNEMRLYQKLNLINNINSDIYYSNQNGLKIKIDENEIIFNNECYINDVYYNVILQDYVIGEKIIILNFSNGKESIKFVLRGNVYAIS
ncbi:MAG: prepilin-type N-terminal cleavage/methylation domain-containing protein [Erysipelotrichaceae bacterium]|nr:prepilin-type N-terminal cleavage/methylation domain-containing protein [Erysipelotrichaceae bacterium]